MAALDFNSEEVEPRKALEAIPAGKYKVVAISSEEKSTKKNDGSYIEFVFEVIEGEYKGRKLWDRLNLNNPNPTAVEIAKQTLSAICRAAGVRHLKDTQQLHDLPLLAKVVAKLDKESGDTRNDIKGYEMVLSSAQPGAGKTPPAKPATAPWQRSK